MNFETSSERSWHGIIEVTEGMWARGPKSSQVSSFEFWIHWIHWIHVYFRILSQPSNGYGSNLWPCLAMRSPGAARLPSTRAVHASGPLSLGLGFRSSWSSKKTNSLGPAKWEPHKKSGSVWKQNSLVNSYPISFCWCSSCSIWISIVKERTCSLHYCRWACPKIGSS